MKIPSELLQSLLRIFYNSQSDCAIYLFQGKIQGLIERQGIIEALSDMNAHEYELPLHEVASLDIVLAKLHDSKQLNNEQKVLPVVNNRLEFVGEWGRTEIIQGWDKTPKVQIWQPASVTRNLASDENKINLVSRSTDENYSLNKLAVNIKKTDLNHQPAENVQNNKRQVAINTKLDTAKLHDADNDNEDKISIINNVKLPQPEIDIRRTAIDIHRDLERGRMAINTLAAISIPLMVCNNEGIELFHNEEFSILQKRFPSKIESEYLLKVAKNHIAELAMKETLDATQAIELTGILRSHQIYTRPIRNQDDINARTLGYLIWLTEYSAQNKDLAPTTPQTEQKQYLGRTLPEILDAEEKRILLWAMDQAGQNQSDAAMLLGIPRQTFSYKYLKVVRNKKAKEKK